MYSSYPGFPNNGFCTSCPNPGDTIVALACEALIYVADDVRYYSSDGIMTSVDLDKPSNPRHRVASQIAVETAPQDDDEMEDENPDELPMGSDQGGSFPLSPEISDDIPVEMGGVLCENLPMDAPNLIEARVLVEPLHECFMAGLTAEVPLGLEVPDVAICVPQRHKWAKRRDWNYHMD